MSRVYRLLSLIIILSSVAQSAFASQTNESEFRNHVSLPMSNGIHNMPKDLRDELGTSLQKVSHGLQIGEEYNPSLFPKRPGDTLDFSTSNKKQQNPEDVWNKTTAQWNLPKEIWLEIFSYLSPEGLLHAFNVCKSWSNSLEELKLPALKIRDRSISSKNIKSLSRIFISLTLENVKVNGMLLSGYGKNGKYNENGENGILLLVSSIRDLPDDKMYLTELILPDNKIDISQLLELLTLPKFKYLDLTNNSIRLPAGKQYDELKKQFLASLGNHTTLTTLILRENPLTLYSAQAIAESLKINRSLTYLDLNDTGLFWGKNQGDALNIFASALEVNTTLQTFILSRNGHSTGLTSLVMALQKNPDSGLTLLDISNNHYNIKDPYTITKAKPDLVVKYSQGRPHKK